LNVGTHVVAFLTAEQYGMMTMRWIIIAAVTAAVVCRELPRYDVVVAPYDDSTWREMRDEAAERAAAKGALHTVMVGQPPRRVVLSGAQLVLPADDGVVECLLPAERAPAAGIIAELGLDENYQDDLLEAALSADDDSAVETALADSVPHSIASAITEELKSCLFIDIDDTTRYDVCPGRDVRWRLINESFRPEPTTAQRSADEARLLPPVTMGRFDRAASAVRAIGSQLFSVFPHGDRCAGYAAARWTTTVLYNCPSWDGEEGVRAETYEIPEQCTLVVSITMASACGWRDKSESAAAVPVPCRRLTF
jgi:hypothetical protein